LIQEEREFKSLTPNISVVKNTNIPQLTRDSHIKNINIESTSVLEKSVIDYLDGKLIGDHNNYIGKGLGINNIKSTNNNITNNNRDSKIGELRRESKLSPSDKIRVNDINNFKIDKKDTPTERSKFNKHKKPDNSNTRVSTSHVDENSTNLTSNSS